MHGVLSAVLINFIRCIRSALTHIKLMTPKHFEFSLVTVTGDCLAPDCCCTHLISIVMFCFSPLYFLQSRGDCATAFTCWLTCTKGVLHSQFLCIVNRTHSDCSHGISWSGKEDHLCAEVTQQCHHHQWRGNSNISITWCVFHDSARRLVNSTNCYVYNFSLNCLIFCFFSPVFVFTCLSVCGAGVECHVERGVCCTSRGWCQHQTSQTAERECEVSYPWSMPWTSC